MTDSTPFASRWSPNPVLARLAFGSGTRDLHGVADGENELELDLDDPAQRTLGDFELLELIGIVIGRVMQVFAFRNQRQNRPAANSQTLQSLTERCQFRSIHVQEFMFIELHFHQRLST